MTGSSLEKAEKKGPRESIPKEKDIPRREKPPLKPGRPGVGDDPLKYCRTCEFQEICENVCARYLE